MIAIDAGRSLIFGIFLCGSLYYAQARSITNADWVEMGQAQGIQTWEDGVYTLAVDSSGRLFAGGGFHGAGGIAAQSTARWDGVKWDPIDGDTLGIFSATPFYIDQKGDLYAGVRHGSAPALNDLARCDGNRWVLLKTGIGSAVNDNGIHAIVSDTAGNIYIGGDFDSVGGIAVNDIAKWDGNSWSGLGSGTGNGDIRTLRFDAAGNLYAGGGFTEIGGTDASHIARWDGSAWHALGTGASNSVLAIVIDDNGDLYAGGWFDTAGGVAARHVARWNGSDWSGLANGVSSSGLAGVSTLAFDSSGTLYAGGNFDSAGGVAACNLAAWDGARWRTVGSAVRHDRGVYGNYAIHALAFGKDGKLYAAGSFTAIGETAADNVAVWDGIVWSALGRTSGRGLNRFVYATAADKNGAVYAGGLFTSGGLKGLGHIGAWNGTDWSPLGKGIYSSDLFNLYAIAAGANGTVYAGGQFDSAGGTYVCNIAQWNNNAWSALGSGMNGLVHTLLPDESGNLFAGGRFSSAGGKVVNNIARWNGSIWSPLGEGIAGDGSVYALAFGKDGELYAGGQFNAAGSVSAQSIAKWDGSAWSSPAINSSHCSVNALAIDGEVTVYAGGWFDSAGGVPAYYVAKWDGSSWNPIGSGLSDRYGSVRALALDGNGMLYAGGDFDTISGTTARNIARWDGGEWSALGSGVDGMVHSLSIDVKGDLFAGGRFTMAGGKVSPYFALCRTGGIKIKVTDRRNIDRGCIGNPVRGVIRTSFETPTLIHIGVYSLSGRKISDKSLLIPGGNRTVGILPPELVRGVYLAQVKSVSTVLRWRVVAER